MLSEDERAALRQHLPPGTREGVGEELEARPVPLPRASAGLTPDAACPVAQRLLCDDACVFFGSPVAAAWNAARAGLAHPRVARYEAALRVLRRTAHTHQCAPRLTHACYALTSS